MLLHIIVLHLFSQPLYYVPILASSSSHFPLMEQIEPPKKSGLSSSWRWNADLPFFYSRLKGRRRVIQLRLLSVGPGRLGAEGRLGRQPPDILKRRGKDPKDVRRELSQGILRAGIPLGHRHLSRDSFSFTACNYMDHWFRSSPQALLGFQRVFNNGRS